MLALYIKDNCPYSKMVLNKLEELHAPVTLKNVSDNRHAIELIEYGGKFQVPCLIDFDQQFSLYESPAIMRYFDENFSKKKK